MVGSCYNDNSCEGEGTPHCEIEGIALPSAHCEVVGKCFRLSGLLKVRSLRWVSVCPLHSDSGGLEGAASPLRDLHYKGKELRRVSPSPAAATPVEKCWAAGGP